MFKAMSLRESNRATDSLETFCNFFSSNSSILAIKYGSSEICSTNFNLFLPWIIIVLLPSGILSILTICATVPTSNKSLYFGSSTLVSFCDTTPIILFPLLASWISLILLSLPNVIGITTPGNKTLFLKGRIGNFSGTSSKFIRSSSSEDINGINSVSPLTKSLNSFQLFSVKKSLITYIF